MPGKRYQFGFWVSITGVDSIDFRSIMRMRFVNNDKENGPCHKDVCNFFTRPLAKNVKSNGGNWQQVISDEFDFFGNFTEWQEYGEVDFILFQLLTRNLAASAEYSVTNFEVFGEDVAVTQAPSTSKSPSWSPTNLIVESVGYVVKYNGEVRTVIPYPFQIDKTGEILADGPRKRYQLCEADEVEGRKAEVSRHFASSRFVCAITQPILT